MSIFSKIGHWFSKTFKSVKTDGAKVAVAITEDIQTALKSGILKAVADVISTLFPSVHDLPAEIIAELQVVIPKVLAAELAVQGLPDHPTEQDIQDFEAKILQAFGVHDNKSKLYTTLAAQVYGIIKKHVDSGAPFTFASLVRDVEEAYEDYQSDKAANQN